MAGTFAGFRVGRGDDSGCGSMRPSPVRPPLALELLVHIRPSLFSPEVFRIFLITGDVRYALETGSLSKAQETAEDLLTLSLECIEMTSSHFRDNCESIDSTDQMCLPKHPVEEESKRAPHVPQFAALMVILFHIVKKLKRKFLTRSCVQTHCINKKNPSTRIDSVLCRIREENVPTSHLESHSFICAHADNV